MAMLMMLGSTIGMADVRTSEIFNVFNFPLLKRFVDPRTGCHCAQDSRAGSITGVRGPYRDLKARLPRPCRPRQPLVYRLGRRFSFLVPPFIQRTLLTRI